MQYERNYANYMPLMRVCFLLALYLANTKATKKANTELHKLLMHLHTLLSLTGEMPLPYISDCAPLLLCI